MSDQSESHESLISEVSQGEEQFHSKNCLLEMPHSYAKMCLKSAP